VAPVHGDLLTPTLAGHRPRDWGSRLPWRVSSQLYVAFLGGPLAVLLVALLNAPRLRLGGRTVALIVAVGVAGTVAGVLAAALVPGDTAPRLVVQLAGVASYGALYLLQRSPDRIHSTFSPHEDPDDDYASLWRPGLAAIVAAWLVQGPLIALLEGVR
jgi:hypothetical protein